MNVCLQKKVDQLVERILFKLVNNCFFSYQEG
jgi:hypothetical protein